MRRIALLLGGTFNPPTVMHLRMLELGRWYLEKQLDAGIVVVAGLMSPVHDGYKKKDLAPAKHRCAMINLSTQNSSWIRLSEWETQQNDWTRTLATLQYHRSLLNSAEDMRFVELTSQTGVSSSPIDVMFLCGADVVKSFNIPGLWKDSDIATLINDFGIVCIARSGSTTSDLFEQHPVVRQADRQKLHLVEEWNVNEMSATRIRKAVRNGECIEYLVSNGVSAYIKRHELYLKGATAKKLIFLLKSASSSDEATTSGGADRFYEEIVSFNANDEEKQQFACEVIQAITFDDGDLQRLHNCLVATDSYSGLIITSKRAAQYVRRSLSDTEVAACMQKWSQKPVFCVGQSTALYVQQLLFDPFGLSHACVVSNSDDDNASVNAEQLAEKVIEEWQKISTTSGEKLSLLFPSSNLKRDVLPKRLDESYIPYEAVEAYITKPAEGLADDLKRRIAANGDRQPDVVVFFSPSGVAAADHVIRDMSILFKQTKYVALGHATAEALKARSYEVSAVATQPTPKAVLNAIALL